MTQEPLLNPVEDYKEVKTYRLNKQAFSTNYLFRPDGKFLANALAAIADDNGYVKVSQVESFLDSMTDREVATAARGTCFKKTENYVIWKRYINWQYDTIEKDLLNSNIDLKAPLNLTFHFGAEEKYDIDSLSKCLIDSFAERFMGGDDSNVKELHMTIEPVQLQKDGFIDLTISNI